MPIDTAVITPGDDFTDTVLGAISWSKGMGRPLRPHLADGFSIVFVGTDTVTTVPGGPEFHPAVVLLPKVWDGDGGSDNYRVEFSVRGLASKEGLTKSALLLGAIDPHMQADIDLRSTWKVMVSLRPGVKWSETPPLAIKPVRTDPREREFQKHDGVLTLPDFGLTDSLL